MSSTRAIDDDSRTPLVVGGIEEEEDEVSLSQYLHMELVTLQNDPTVLATKWKPFLSQTDAVIQLKGDSSKCQLPALDWKGQFRKSYSLLFWIRPILGNEVVSEDVDEDVDEDVNGGVAKSFGICCPTRHCGASFGNHSTHVVGLFESSQEY